MRFKALKVGELAQRTGLTVRTLHHYDAIGLLRPSLHTEAGYRLYTAGDITRLQQVLLVFFDFLIATGQVECNLGHVMDVGVADVRDVKTGGQGALLVTGEGLVGAATGRDADKLDTQLFGEYQILRGEVAGDLQGNLNAGRERIEGPPTGEDGAGPNSGGADGADEITSVQGAIAVSHSDCLLETVTRHASSTSTD